MKIVGTENSFSRTINRNIWGFLKTRANLVYLEQSISTENPWSKADRPTENQRTTSSDDS